MRTIVVSIALAACAFSQDIGRSFELKYVNPDQVRVLLQSYPITASAAVANLHMISVRGSKETLESVAELIKKIDVPAQVAKNIEFTGYMIFASTKAVDAVEPPELAPVIKQMRTLFTYKSYRVGETFSLRCRDGQRADANGMVQLPDSPDRRPYNFTFSSAALTGEKAIRMDKVFLNIRGGSESLGFLTDLDMREGQKVVVGKSTIKGSDDALILVLSAKVVE